MSKHILSSLITLLMCSASFAESQEKEAVCAKITIQITNFWFFEDTLSTTNCEGTAEIARVATDANKGFFITSFDLTKFEIPSDKGKKTFLKTFNGDFQQVIFYNTDPFDLSTWKTRTKGKKTVPSQGKFTINGKNIPVRGDLNLYDSYNELVVETTFKELGLQKPDIDGFFRKQKDQVTFTVSSPHQNLEM